MAMTEIYKFGIDYLSDSYEEVGGHDFYRELFPDNENEGEVRKTGEFKSNAIYIYHDYDNKFRHRIMLNDTWDYDFYTYVAHHPLIFCSGLSYLGRRNTLKNARLMHALVFDLDGVDRNGYYNLFQYMTKDPASDEGKLLHLPIPTFVAPSGKGIHLYYVFDQPISLFPNVKDQLKKVKRSLTQRLWVPGVTSTIDIPQYQGINQGFRMIGSYNSNYGDGTMVRAFRTGERVTVGYMNKFLHPDLQIDPGLVYKPSTMTRAEAADKYPDWYQRVVVEGKKRPKKWKISEQKGHRGDELYNWWFNKIYEKQTEPVLSGLSNAVYGGHRYCFLYCLAAYACKCDIPRKRLEADMQTAYNVLKDVQHDNELTQEDVRAAMKAYSKEYYNMTIEEIEYKSGIRIEPNKRNTEQYKSYFNRMGDKALPRQKWHLQRARAVQEINYPDGDWRGRPSARQTVEDYRRKNPDATKADCCRATGLHRHTVYKWWERTE